jgi:hypothetical protein
MPYWDETSAASRSADMPATFLKPREMYADDSTSITA